MTSMRRFEETIDESKPVKPLSAESVELQRRDHERYMLGDQIFKLLCRLDDLTPEDEEERKALVEKVKALQRERLATKQEPTT